MLFVRGSQDDGLAAAHEAPGNRAAEVADTDDCGCHGEDRAAPARHSHPGTLSPETTLRESQIRSPRSRATISARSVVQPTAWRSDRWGHNGFIEHYSAAVRGQPIGAVVVVTFDAGGQTQHVAANYRPLSSLLLLSRLVGEKLACTPYAKYFLASNVPETHGLRPEYDAARPGRPQVFTGAAYRCHRALLSSTEGPAGPMKEVRNVHQNDGEGRRGDADHRRERGGTDLRERRDTGVWPRLHRVFSSELGTYVQPNFVEHVFGGIARVGTPTGLNAVSGSDSSEDFINPHPGHMSDYYQLGLVSASVNRHYGSLTASQPEYASQGIRTGLCVGVPRSPFQGEALSLQPCTIPGRTVWIIATSLSPVIAGAGLFPNVHVSWVGHSEGVREVPRGAADDGGGAA